MTVATSFDFWLAAAQAWGVRPEEIRTGKKARRYAPLPDIRKSIAGHMRDQGASYQEIARFLGYAEHTSAMYAVQACRRQIVTRPEFAVRHRLTLRLATGGGQMIIPDRAAPKPVTCPAG
jgi:hypothetical protein